MWSAWNLRGALRLAERARRSNEACSTCALDSDNVTLIIKRIKEDIRRLVTNCWLSKTVSYAVDCSECKANESCHNLLSQIGKKLDGGTAEDLHSLVPMNIEGRCEDATLTIYDLFMIYLWYVMSFFGILWCQHIVFGRVFSDCDVPIAELLDASEHSIVKPFGWLEASCLGKRGDVSALSSHWVFWGWRPQLGALAKPRRAAEGSERNWREPGTGAQGKQLLGSGTKLWRVHRKPRRGVVVSCYFNLFLVKRASYSEKKIRFRVGLSFLNYTDYTTCLCIGYYS